MLFIHIPTKPCAENFSKKFLLKLYAFLRKSNFFEFLIKFLNDYIAQTKLLKKFSAHSLKTRSMENCFAQKSNFFFKHTILVNFFNGIFRAFFNENVTIDF